MDGAGPRTRQEAVRKRSCPFYATCLPQSQAPLSCTFARTLIQRWQEGCEEHPVSPALLLTCQAHPSQWPWVSPFSLGSWLLPGLLAQWLGSYRSISLCPHPGAGG